MDEAQQAMKTRALVCVMLSACWLTLVLNEATRTFAFWNLVVQLAIFLPFANLPAWANNRLSYVDFAWPVGLGAIGIQAFFLAEAPTPRTIVVASFYTIVGLRMGVWGAHIYVGHEELPRYQYQRWRWKRAGFRSERLSVQYEICVQLMANASFLALPAILIATNVSRTLNALEICAIMIWVACYALESLADWQKRRFGQGVGHSADDVCDVGLWHYSRHPNYFFQWMQWVALVALALPSACALYGRIPPAFVCLLGAALIWVTRMMYTTMVHYTGAVPAEYYSLRKRPGYADYQSKVNRFFPGPRKSPKP